MVLMLLCFTPSNTQACSLNPVAQIASPVNEDVHYTGEAVLFNGSASVAMCGTITSYTWRVRNGGFGPWTQVSTSPIYWHTFTTQGTSWQVQLQVHNTVGRTHTRTITGIHVNNAPESQYYLTDHLGSVRAVVNRDGDLLSWSDYYPFGLPMPTRSGNTSNAHDMIKFTGYEAEDEGDLGWYHAEARTYDPFIGRFTSVDPMAHLYPDHSPYHYVLNNPMNYIDPSGEYIVSKDGSYVTRIPQGALRTVSALQAIPGIGTFATLNKIGMSGDPSVSFNAGDALSLVSLGIVKSIRASYGGVKKMTQIERNTLNTFDAAMQVGSTALGIMLSDDANLFIDSQIFSVATSLGLGHENIANPGFFKVSDGAISRAQSERKTLNQFIGEQFGNIEGILKDMALEGGYNLNDTDDQRRFRAMIRNTPVDDLKARIGQ